MKRKPRTISLQLLLACLTTHPIEAKKASKDPLLYIEQFPDLSKKDKQNFISFFKTHTRKFEIATLLLSKKRWEEAQDNLGVLMHVFDRATITQLWNEYTENLHLQKSIPNNPVNDVLEFIHFLQNNAMLEQVKLELCEYKSIKLNLLSLPELQIYKSQLTEDPLVVNNTLIRKDFSYMLSKLLPEIKKNKKIPKNLSEYAGDERLALFLNNKKLSVTVVRLTPYLDDLIQSVHTHKNIADSFRDISKKYPSQYKLFLEHIRALEKIKLVECSTTELKEGSYNEL